MTPVLHAITGLDPTGGGPPVALEGLVLAQLRAGARVGVVATFRDGDDLSRADRLRNAGAEVTLLGPTTGRLQRVADMRNVVAGLMQADGRPGVVHVHNLWEQLQHEVARATRRAGIPRIVRPCGMLDPWSLRQSVLAKKLMLLARVRGDLRTAAALHFTTETERDLVAPLRLGTPSIVEPNGVTLKEFAAPAGSSVPPRNGAEGLRLLFLSRLHPKKAPDVLLDAFERVCAGWPEGKHPPSLTLAGPSEGGTLEDLKAQLATLPASRDRVRFAGLVVGEQKAALLREADLFCLPSHQENFGIAVVEALAAGTPVLISDQVNIHAEVAAAGVGEATSVDAAAYAEALRRWLLDDAKRAAAATEATAFVAERYDWDAIATRWAAHYGTLAGVR